MAKVRSKKEDRDTIVHTSVSEECYKMLMEMAEGCGTTKRIIVEMALKNLRGTKDIALMMEAHKRLMNPE